MELLGFASHMRVALYQCGSVSLALQGRVEPEQKAPDSSHQRSTAVSAVDRVCQEILMLAAASVAPDLAVYSEEMAACPDELQRRFRGSSGYELVLDPVDGTDDYLAGRPTFGHMLGLLNLSTGRFDLGMLYFPTDGVLLWGLREMGAFVARGVGGADRRLPTPTAPRIVPQVKRMRPEDVQALTRMGLALETDGVASIAWRVRRLAEGDTGVGVFRQFHGHDTGPGSAILEELGGAVLDGDGESARYAADMPRDPLIVASADAELARDVVAALVDGVEAIP